jgi:hypothetical protein
MALGDPFSSTYEGSYQSGLSLGTGIQSATDSITTAIKERDQKKLEQQQMQKMMDMIGMGKQVGAIKTEEVPLSKEEIANSYEQGVANISPSIFKSQGILTGSSDLDTRISQYQKLFQAAGVPQPKTTKTITTVDADAMDKAQSGRWTPEITYEDGKMKMTLKQKSPPSEEVQAMREQNQEMAKERLDVEKQNSQSMMNQRKQQMFDKATDMINPARTSRSVLGIAARSNLAMKNALTILKKPTVTNGELSFVLNQLGELTQDDPTAQSKIAGWSQFISGDPKNALPDNMRREITTDIIGMMGNNAQVIKDQTKFIEDNQKSSIEPFRDQWDQSKEDLFDSVKPPSNDAEQLLGATPGMSMAPIDYKKKYGLN